MARVKKNDAIPAADVAHKPTGGRAKGGAFTSDLKSIRVNLTGEDKKRIPSTSYVQEDILPVIQDYLEDGKKFSCSLDADNATFICTLTHFDESAITHKHCLQGRGKTLVLAWASMRYKDDVLLGGDWTASVANDDEFGIS